MDGDRALRPPEARAAGSRRQKVIEDRAVGGAQVLRLEELELPASRRGVEAAARVLA